MVWRDTAAGFEFLAEAGFTDGGVGRKNHENIFTAYTRIFCWQLCFQGFVPEKVETWIHP